MEYGPLKIVPERRQLVVDGAPTPVGTRAYEIAFLLVEAKGKLVSKDEIMRRVWPATIVEENNIQVAVSALRKALGRHAAAIRTIAGRGYRLVVPPLGTNTNVSAETRTLVGREGVVERLEGLLGKHPIVTLTGAGGMGKTCLALEMARRQRPQFPDGVWLIEMASLVEGSAVSHAVASALHLDIPDSLAQPKRIASLVASRKLLLVLDNCEHVIDAVADLAYALVNSNPVLRVLATSREPLRMAGEVLYRIAPLGVPPDDVTDSERLLGYGAVQLFIARTRAMASDLVLDGASIAAIGTICRRLDGIPLAIEIAASRAATLGIVELSKHLDDQFRLLTSGFRTALPRHRTLRATFDWSYDLLTDTEQRGLRRLAMPVGRFSLNMAKALLVDGSKTAASPEETIAGLVEKSLLVAEMVQGDMRYRLLDTTRAYALPRLQESGEFDQVARRHAKYCLDVFASAESDWQGHVRADSLDHLEHLDLLGNARMALDWAFSPKGDAALGFCLTVAAVPVWIFFSMAMECRQYTLRALAIFAANPQPDSDLEMKLLTAHGMALLSTMAPGAHARQAFERGLEIAVRLDNRDYRLRNLWGLSSVCVNDGDFRAAREIAERFHALALASGDPSATGWADLLLAGVMSVLGDLGLARHHLEAMLERSDGDAKVASSNRFLFNEHVLALGLLGSILWQQGHVEECKRRLEESVAEAVSGNDVLSLCNTLANWVCILMLERGDLADAERYLAMMVDYASRYRLDFWLLWARCFEGALATRQADGREGIRILRESFADLSGVDKHPRFTKLRGFYAEALYQAGEEVEALAVVETALELAERNGHLWMLPEFLRIKGCVLQSQPAVETRREADKILRRALDLAYRQGSLWSQLRIAISLVRMHRTHGQLQEALAILRHTYGKFHDGFETTDLKEARSLLETSSAAAFGVQSETQACAFESKQSGGLVSRQR
jgi:predicted ATPase/DNA-binding winged helix-turn-helix (wHTH) protein